MMNALIVMRRDHTHAWHSRPQNRVRPSPMPNVLCHETQSNWRALRTRTYDDILESPWSHHQYKYNEALLVASVNGMGGKKASVEWPVHRAILLGLGYAPCTETCTAPLDHVTVCLINLGFRSMPGGRACAARQAASNRQCLQTVAAELAALRHRRWVHSAIRRGGGGWRQVTGRWGGWVESGSGPGGVGGWGTQPSVQRTHYATQSGS